MVKIQAKPSSHSKKKSNSRLHILQKNIQDATREIEEIKRVDRAKERVRMEIDREPTRLIPKPRGSAGKNPPKGYNLQEAIGLADNKPRYNNLLAIVRQYARETLTLGKTISLQDERKVFLVVEKARKNHKFFRKFANAWPARAMIGQYLKNIGKLWNSRLKKVAKDDDDDESSDHEGNPKQSHHDAADFSDDDTNPPTEDNNSDGSEHETACSDATEQEDSDGPRRKRAKLTKVKSGGKKKSAPISAHIIKGHQNQSMRTKTAEKPTRVTRKIVYSDDSDDDLPVSQVLIKQERNTKSKRQEKAAPAIKKVMMEAKVKVEKAAPAIKKATTEAKVKVEKATPAIKKAMTEVKVKVEKAREDRKNDMDVNAWFDGQIADVLPKKVSTKGGPRPKASNQFIFNAAKDIPAECPAAYCEDMVPANPSSRLIRMFKRLKQAEYDLSIGKGTEILVLRTQLEICGAMNKENMKQTYITHSNARGWTINIDFAILSRRVLSMKEELDGLLVDTEEKEKYYCWEHFTDEVARCKLSLKSLANKTVLNVPEIIANLSKPGYYGEKGRAIIESTLLCMYDPTETPTSAFAPLSLAQYTQWFLTPHVATRLIQQDLDCSYETAWEEMAASKETGMNLQQIEDDDPAFEHIIQNTMREMLKERQYTKDKNLKNVGAAEVAGPSKFPGAFETVDKRIDNAILPGKMRKSERVKIPAFKCR